MNISHILTIVPMIFLGLSSCQSTKTDQSKNKIVETAQSPNIIIIFCDDMGYADISPFGATAGLTPNLDKMAEEGMKFTNFYSAYATCTCSRASLLTGSYPQRLGMQGNFLPKANKGLNPDETTIAEMLKQRAYKTAMFGKWHLGDAPEFMPTNQGFDEFYGFPYSHDMWPFHPQNEKYDFPPLPLYNGTNVINPDVHPEDVENLTADLTSKAVDFIKRNKENPFFIYMPYPLPHVPLVVSKEFDGKTKQGAYADVIAELDEGIGQIFKALKENGVDENTLVVFTSDNGPWTWYGEHGGSAGPLRGSKGTVYEGGYRIPCIMRWPAKIPAGTLNDVMSGTIDLLPTIATISNTSLPNVKIDGKNSIDLLMGNMKSSLHKAYFYNMTAVRSGDWKLILPHKTQVITEPGKGGYPGERIRVDVPLSLYNLKDDIGEMTNLAEKNPDIVSKLRTLLEAHNTEIRANQRPIGAIN